MEQTFGSYVREKRMARGLSLRGLAAKLEVSPVYMSNMENDRRPAPTKEKMDRLIGARPQLFPPGRAWE